MELIFNRCADNISTTGRLNISEINLIINGSSSTAKTVISRLKTKNCISIFERKNGRGGWCRYEIHRGLFNEMKKAAPFFYGGKNGLQEKNTPSLYNNNGYYYKKEGGEQNSINPSLPKEVSGVNSKNQQIEPLDQVDALENDPWLQIDYSDLEPAFKKMHITQLRKVEDLTPELVQESINHFVWMLNNDAERKSKFSPEKNPIQGLIGSLKKGNPWVEPGYIDPKVKAFDDLNAFKRKRLEEIRKRKEEAFNLDFEIWLEETDSKVIAEIESKQGVKGKTMNDSRYRGMMKDYFKNHHHQSDK
jgi:hypothetical protein